MNENTNKRVNLHIYNEENYTKLKMLAMIEGKSVNKYLNQMISNNIDENKNKIKNFMENL